MDRFDKLIALLQDEAAPLAARRDAARDLAWTKDLRCIEPMLALLATPQPYELRFELLFDLALLHDPRAFDAFCRILRDPTEATDLRAFAAELLTTLEGVDPVPVLIEALQQTEPMIRFDAAWSLASVGDERARPALEQHRSDPARPYPDLGSIGDIATKALARLVPHP